MPPRPAIATGDTRLPTADLPTGGAAIQTSFVAPAFALGAAVPRRPAATTWRSGADEVSSGSVSRRILDPASMQKWQRSDSHRDVLRFLSDLCDAVVGRRLTDEVPKSNVVYCICDVLQEASTWIDEIPPQQQAMRYGNPAYKQWHAKLCQRAPDLMRSIVQAAAALRPPAMESTLNAALPASFIESAIPTRERYEASLRLPPLERAALEREAREAATGSQRESASQPTSTMASNLPPPAAVDSTQTLELAAYFAESFGKSRPLGRRCTTARSRPGCRAHGGSALHIRAVPSRSNRQYDANRLWHRP